jgi:hypothetical protein
MKKYGEYQCQKCGKYAPEEPYKKKVNGKFKVFPIISNIYDSYNGEYSGHYWTETHYCCGEEFSFETSNI